MKMNEILEKQSFIKIKKYVLSLQMFSQKYFFSFNVPSETAKCFFLISKSVGRRLENPMTDIHYV